MMDLFYNSGRSLFGFNIIESKDTPRYVLPKEIIPGVSWPKGFREEINDWSIKFLGTTNILPKNTMYVLGHKAAIMRPEDIVKISNIGI